MSYVLDPDVIETIGKVVGLIIAPIAALWFGWRKLVQEAQKQVHENNKDFRIAELEDQQKFRSQLIETVVNSQRLIADQASRISRQEEEMGRLRVKSEFFEEHFRECTEEMAKLRESQSQMKPERT